jgi:hypothetical protein
MLALAQASFIGLRSSAQLFAEPRFDYDQPQQRCTRDTPKESHPD